MNRCIRATFGALLLMYYIPAIAGDSGWSARTGYTWVKLDVNSGDLTGAPGAKLDIEDTSNVSFSIQYDINDNLSVKLFMGLPLELDVVGDGTFAGVGKLGKIDAYPPTLFLKYYFSNEKIRPFVGFGLTRAIFKDAEPTATLLALTANPNLTISADPAWGLTPIVGVRYSIDEQWYTEVAVAKLFVDTTAYFSNGKSVDVALYPWAANLAIGYNF